MIGGFLIGVAALIGISWGCKRYVKKRIKREVKIIDNITYPKNVRRERKITSRRSDKIAGRKKNIGYKGGIEAGRRIQIPKNNVREGSEPTQNKNGKRIELHKPTAL